MRPPFTTVCSYLLAVTSGLLFALAFPPVDRGAIAFVALTPLILAVWGQSRRRAAALAWVAGTIGCTMLVAPSIFVAARGYFGGGVGVALAMALALSQLYGALPIALFGIATRAVLAIAPPPLVALVAMPTIWVATEMLRAHLGHGVPWVLLAHAQHARLWMLQVADLGGAAAVSWVVALVSAGLALLIAGPARGRRGVVAGVALVLVGVRAYGAWQLAVWRAPGGPPLAVALVQPAVPEDWRVSLGHVPDVLARLHALTREAATGHPALVVWPENAVSVAVEANPRVVAALADVLDDDARVLLGGTRTVAQAGGALTLRNAAFLADPQGRVTGVYEKQRLTPYGEFVPWPLRPFTRARDLYTPGDGPVLLGLGDHRLGTMICSEAIDADLVRRLVQEGADLLVNIAHDGWFGTAAARAQHLAAAALRAVENRRFLLRATSDGLSAIVDPRGAVVQAAPAGIPAVLAATITTPRTSSFYTRHGDLFGWFCVATTLIGLFRRPAQSRAARPAAMPIANTPQPIAVVTRNGTTAADGGAPRIMRSL
jgi:apolipoprotein N-acyltransferase